MYENWPGRHEEPNPSWKVVGRTEVIKGPYVVEHTYGKAIPSTRGSVLVLLMSKQVASTRPSFPVIHGKGSDMLGFLSVYPFKAAVICEEPVVFICANRKRWPALTFAIDWKNQTDVYAFRTNTVPSRWKVAGRVDGGRAT